MLFTFVVVILVLKDSTLPLNNYNLSPMEKSSKTPIDLPIGSVVTSNPASAVSLFSFISLQRFRTF